MAFEPAARAAPSAEYLAKLAQNPIANLISVPFQNNTNFDYGPDGGTQNILNIQPVIPITLNQDWNLITRTILPLIWQPELGPQQNSTFGLGDTQFSAFLSPSNAKGWIWGVGAIAQLPTHSDSALGTTSRAAPTSPAPPSSPSTGMPTATTDGPCRWAAASVASSTSAGCR